MKRLIAGMFLLVMFSAAACAAFFHMQAPQQRQGVEVKAVGEPSQETMAVVKMAVQDFTALTEAAGAPLSHGVELFVASTQEQYEQVLTKEFSHSPEEAAQIASLSGGWTGGKQGQTVLNGAAGVMQGRSDRLSTTAHELFHQLQYDLSHGRDADEKALFWLEEGSADYVGALVAERCGGKSLHKWQFDTLQDLRLAKETARPESLLHCTLSQRIRLMDKKYHSYQMADVMVVYLMQQQEQGTEFAALVRYFEALSEAKDGEEAFAQVFGMTQAQFLRDFQAWYQQERTVPFTASFVRRDGVSEQTVQALEAQMRSAQPLLASLYGQQLCGRYDVVLAADAEDFAKAAETYAGVTEEKARALAADSLWVQDGSTILLNVSELGDEKQLVFSVGTLCARLLHMQMAGITEEPVDWLDRGMTYLVGIRLLEQAGYGHYADYRRSWLYGVQKAGALPSLEELLTSDAMHRAAETYGDEVVNEMTELAADELLSRFGWKACRSYLLHARESGKERAAFRAAFGRDTAAYAKEFALARSSRR